MGTRNGRPSGTKPTDWCRRLPLALLLLFLLMFLAGIGLNEPARVLEQARAICLSCIGIG